jgi:hypothetical protein
VLPRSPQCDAISFLVEQTVSPGTQYDNGPFDRDDRPGHVALCAGGRYLEDKDAIQVTREGATTSDAVAFEAEHWFLRWHNPGEYERTKYHTPETPHPILKQGE